MRDKRYPIAAYDGGRAECAVRRTPLPVDYTNGLSIDPTVNALMGLWRLHVADRVEVEGCAEEARAVWAEITPDTVRDPATWPRLALFGRIVPDGDVLPVRAEYGDAGSARNIDVNPFTDGAPHWYAGPDPAAALLTGTVPKALRAWRPVAVGWQPGLASPTPTRC